MTHFRCDESTSQCVDDPSGPYTDAALCGANCPKLFSAQESPAADDGPAAPPSLTNLTQLTNLTKFSECPGQNVTITLAHTAEQAMTLPASLTAYRIDEAHTNPLAAWRAQGSPVYPTKGQLSALDTASEVVPAESIQLVRLGNTRSSLTFYMPPYSVLKLSI